MPNSPWQDQLHVYSLFRDFFARGNIARGKLYTTLYLHNLNKK